MTTTTEQRHSAGRAARSARAGATPAFSSDLRASEQRSSLRCQRCSGEFEPASLQQSSTRLCDVCTSTLQLAMNHGADSSARINTMIDTPHPFTAADRALIKRLHGYMPAAQLLELINQRLVADHGDRSGAHTLEQLRAEISAQAATGSVGGGDAPGGGWSGIRKVLADARRTGVLALINESVINDFAVVFSLNAKQVLQLKDVLLSSEASR